MKTTSKQDVIKHLTELLTTIQAAYFKGKMEGHRLWVHESCNNDAAISIDLYHFGGDGRPVCDGLNPCTITYDDGTTDTGNVYCMCYNPDDVSPLCFLFEPDRGDDVDIEPEALPEESLANIVRWLQEQVGEGMIKKSNDVTSFFFYMWNAWSKEECERAFAGGNPDHFWKKWCGIYNAYGVYGAAERFYAELSSNNRDKLVKRACEVYDRNEEKQ